jgi:hypothetical protein
MGLKAMDVCYNEHSEQARAPHTHGPRDVALSFLYEGPLDPLLNARKLLACGEVLVTVAGIGAHGRTAAHP